MQCMYPYKLTKRLYEYILHIQLNSQQPWQVNRLPIISLTNRLYNYTVFLSFSPKNTFASALWVANLFWKKAFLSTTCMSYLISQEDFTSTSCMSHLISHNAFTITYSMKQGPSWESNRFSASQEIHHFYWTRMFITGLQVTATCHPEPDQSSPSPPSHLLKINLSIILPSTPGSPKWSLSLRFPHQIPVYACPLSHTCYVPRPTHYSRYDHPNNNWWAGQIIKLLLCSFLNSPVTSSLLGPNIHLNTQFSNSLGPHSSLHVIDQVSHPYKTGKIIDLYIF